MSKSPAKQLKLPASARLRLVPPAQIQLLGLPSRLERIDFARGLAVVAMIAFHLAFDFHQFSKTGRLNLPAWFWWAVPCCIGGTFLTLLGASVSIRWERDGDLAAARVRAHALRIGGCALAVNVGTMLFTPATPIYFGILHAAAVSLFALSFCLGRAQLQRNFGAGLALAGLALAPFTFTFPHLLWLGLRPAENAGWDYYPLLPWMGVALLGAWAALRFQFAAKADPVRLPRRLKVPLLWLGRHSLFVYIVHQPILLALLWLAGISR